MAIDVAITGDQTPVRRVLASSDVPGVIVASSDASWAAVSTKAGASAAHRDRASASGAVYNLYIMRRTQIYLTDEQGRLLEERSRARGRTISQLIRDAIDEAYAPGRPMSRAERVRLARRTAGAWAEFAESGAQFVDRIRGARRLARLHGDR